MNIFKRSSTMPATQAPATGSLGARGNAMMNSATEFYRRNPKTVGTAALIGAAALLGLVTNRGLRR
jgi:hypothetical protein